MKATEYECEPVPGLPAALPAGETVFWQGAPSWRALARRAFHADLVAIYFSLLALWRAGAALATGRTGAEAAGSCLWLAPPAAAAIGLLVLLAWLTARTTVYTITSRRVVMRYGIAFPATVNLPFRVVASADLKGYPDGTGDIPLTLTGPDSIAYLYLWPHARPWRLKSPQPMLRVVPEAERAAGILAQALTAFAAEAAAKKADADAPTLTAEPRYQAVAA